MLASNLHNSIGTTGSLANLRFFAFLAAATVENLIFVTRLSIAGADRPSYVKALYQRFLGREADTGGLKHYLKRAETSRSMLRWRLGTFRDLAQSPEFWNRVSKRALVKDVNEAHHEARQLWVKRHIPAAKNILDLGGSSSYDTDGSLLALGYPHKPESITIIDFPPQDRVASSHSTLTEENHTAKNGAQIRFIYDSFVNLDRFADRTFDLVTAGQVIEHVTPEEGQSVLRNVFRILKPGGHLCLDTPNVKITKLISGGAFIHPEHKLEYECAQLRRMAVAAGFEVLEEGAISPMPISLASKKFLPHELSANVGLGPVADNGFSFFLSLRKPG